MTSCGKNCSHKDNQSYMPKSKSDVHETPERVFAIIDIVWGYQKQDMFDPCPVNWKEDGLKIEWDKLNFVNPPYSLLKEFVYKAFNESDRHYNKTIMLLPAKTDQEWFHNIVSRECEIKWIEKRLKFKNDKWSATQPHFLAMIK